MTTPDMKNCDELLTQTNPAETKKKNIRFAVALYVACVFGGTLIEGWVKVFIGLSVAPIETLAFQFGVAVVPFVFGWLIAKVVGLALKKISFNTVWAVSATIWMLLGFYGQQNAVGSADIASCVEYYNKKDLAKAAQACRKAADRGDARAQYNFGQMHRTGQGVAKDDAQAASWYTLAAEQGLVEAQHNLGVMHRNGQGVAQDYVQAMRWFKMAASQGLASSQNNLAWMYYLGHGVAQDYVRSHMWYNLAAVAGDENSVEGRDAAASVMTREQIAQAQQMARDCTAKNYKAC